MQSMQSKEIMEEQINETQNRNSAENLEKETLDDPHENQVVIRPKSYKGQIFSTWYIHMIGKKQTQTLVVKQWGSCCGSQSKMTVINYDDVLGLELRKGWFSCWWNLYLVYKGEEMPLLDSSEAIKFVIDSVSEAMAFLRRVGIQVQQNEKSSDDRIWVNPNYEQEVDSWPKPTRC